jgi:hypothetical protein
LNPVTAFVGGEVTFLVLALTSSLFPPFQLRLLKIVEEDDEYPNSIASTTRSGKTLCLKAFTGSMIIQLGKPTPFRKSARLSTTGPL